MHYSLDSVADGLDSERANAAGLAQLMQILGGAPPPQQPPQPSMGGEGGRRMAECVVGGAPARPRAREKRAGSGASGKPKVALSHLADDEEMASQFDEVD